VCGADKLATPHVPIFSKSGSLNLLEPSGPVKACNGIAYLYHYITTFLGSHIIDYDNDGRMNCDDKLEKSERRTQ
jgi:hypothetical protein